MSLLVLTYKANGLLTGNGNLLNLVDEVSCLSQCEALTLLQLADHLDLRSSLARSHLRSPTQTFD